MAVVYHKYNSALDNRSLVPVKQDVVSPVDVEKEQSDYLILADALAEESSISGGLNFLEITEEKVRDILNNPASKAIQQNATLILGKLKKFSAGRERNPDKRAQLYNEAIEMLDRFIRDNPDYSGLSEARFELSELLQEKARFLTGMARVEANPVKKQGLIEQVELTYTRINEYLNIMIKDYQEMLENIHNPVQGEEIDNKIMRASYTLGLNSYYQGLLYNKGDDNHKKYLKEAIKSFNTFALKYGDKLLSYEVYDYIGLCYYELDDYKSARLYFKSTASLYKAIMDDDEKTKEEKNEIIYECCDIIQRGYTHLAMIANATREYGEAIKIIDDMFKIFPKNQSEEWMEMGLLEQARALFYIGNKEQARSTVQGLKDNSRNISVRSAADDVLRGFTKMEGGK